MLIEKSQRARNNWGAERYENNEIQKRVALNYEKLIEETWCSIDADQEKFAIHSQVLQQVLNTLQKVKNLPIGKLYMSST